MKSQDVIDAYVLLHAGRLLRGTEYWTAPLHKALWLPLRKRLRQPSMLQDRLNALLTDTLQP